VNVAFGGTLVQHMEEDHRHHVAMVKIDSQAADLGLDQDVIMASCYHHQVIQKLGEGLEVIAYSAEGHIEAVAIDSKGWAFGLQWHPEDTWDTDKNQAAIFNRFVAEAAKA
jgi:putative glutamine amidotransferase